jgi:hypothetical protein
MKGEKDSAQLAYHPPPEPPRPGGRAPPGEAAPAMRASSSPNLAPSPHPPPIGPQENRLRARLGSGSVWVRLGGEVGGSRQEGTALNAGCCRLPCRGCGSELEAAQLCSARPLPTPCFFMMGRRRRSHTLMAIPLSFGTLLATLPRHQSLSLPALVRTEVCQQRSTLLLRAAFRFFVEHGKRARW